ncbi:MAG: hypothetical protein J5845_02025 [Lachnospiraceae bacterium]|nr:hypothetical protein [Lachnospiraceae bacterium]
MEYNRLPDEYNRLPVEDRMPPEIAAPAPECPPMTLETALTPERHTLSDVSDEEFASSGAAESRRNRKKHELFRSFAAPVAATVATISIVLASFNIDPIGLDFLNDNLRKKSPISQIVVTVPTAEPATPTPTPTPTPEPTPLPDFLNYPEGSVNGAEDVSWIQYIVTDPNGETFTSSLSENDPIDEVTEWVRGWGGDWRNLIETSRSKEFLGYQKSDDLIIAGSFDSPERIQILGGHIYAVYKEVICYDALLKSHGEGYYEFGDPALPTLDNLAPDFVGAYAWSNMGSEEFVRFSIEGQREYSYLQLGVAWAEMGGSLKEVPGASYDASTNVLTLENCTAEGLELNLMGNGFTIKLIGENSLGYIHSWGAEYAGSITFTGSGSLVVNENRTYAVGINIEAEWSPSALIVDKGVDILIYGTTHAILISSTSLEKAIWFLKDETLMSGGTRKADQFVEYYQPGIDENGNTVNVPYTLEEICELYDGFYTDYSVVVPDGTPATFVEFESRR